MITERYNWNYQIKIRTKSGTYEFEPETLYYLELLREKLEEQKENNSKRLVKTRVQIKKQNNRMENL